ncbi:copper resistance CopC family protein [Ilumatobacter sp.]|uniref:copper resistance CopC family protein n=1 Tax=Ilumatobacter sp. TaxID=1967498 RepID=UPI003AF564FC
MRDASARPRLLAAMVAFVIALVVQPGAASAHTDLDFTAPADGDTVTEPVAEVTVAFTAAVELVGNGFEALDPQGNLIQPLVVTDDDQVFRLQFDPPLAGGAVGVRYEIRADDGHVLPGSFSFVVDAVVPPTSTPTTEPAAAAPPPATTAPSPAATEPAAPSSTTSVAPAPTDVPTTSGVTTTNVAAEESSDAGSSIGLVLAIVAAIAVGLGGFLVVRSRTSGAP